MACQDCAFLYLLWDVALRSRMSLIHGNSAFHVHDMGIVSLLLSNNVTLCVVQAGYVKGDAPRIHLSSSLESCGPKSIKDILQAE